jgi:hypothetical protein
MREEIAPLPLTFDPNLPEIGFVTRRRAPATMGHVVLDSSADKRRRADDTQVT